MSDQHEPSSDRGSSDGPQDQKLQGEGLDTMRVRVTNVIDGFFKFATSSTTSNMSGSHQQGEMPSESGGQRQRFPPNNLLQASANAKSSTESVGSQRIRSTKKVKFKDDSSRSSKTSHLASNLLMESSTMSKRFSNDEGSNDNMDESGSSVASWDIRIEPDGGEGTSSGDAEVHAQAPLSPRAAAALRKTTNKTINQGETEVENPADDSRVAMWFEKYMPTSVNRIRAFCGRVVLNDTFQIAMVLLIVANALCMGLATFDFIDDNARLRDLFTLVDYIFLVVFTIELALQFGYWGYQVFFDGWLLFDFITIMSSWLLEGVQIFRSFRIFRAFRLVVRIPILKSLVYAVIHVLPRISSIMALFALIIYIFAVMSTTLFKDYYARGITSLNYFGRLDYSLFTLFQFVTLEGWGDIVREVAAEDYFAYFLFGTFLTISSFILYSLVVAVICDSFLVVETQIRAEMEEQARLEQEKRKGGQDDDEDEDDEDEDDEDSRGDGESPGRSPMLDSSAPLLRLPSPDMHHYMREKTPREAPAKKKQSPPPSLRTPPQRKKSKEVSNDKEKQDKTEEETLDQANQRYPLKITEITSPTATTITRTLASGELERKKHRKKKTRPVKQRIKRVQMRLEKLTKTQAEILSTLDDLCKQIEEER